MGKIKAIVKRADEEVGHMTWISDSLQNLQKIVGGYIETVTLPGGVVIICDEEGRIKGKPFNCVIFPHSMAARVDFYGDIIAVGDDADEFSDVPIDLKLWKQIFLGKEDK